MTGCEDPSSSEDEFEKMMDTELNSKMYNLEHTWLNDLHQSQYCYEIYRYNCVLNKTYLLFYNFGIIGSGD